MASDRAVKPRREPSDIVASGPKKRWPPGSSPGIVACGLLVCLVAGCWQSSPDPLLGRWIGRPLELPDAERDQLTVDARSVTVRSVGDLEFELELLPNQRFRMALRNGREPVVDRREGRYRVTRVYGPRRDVVLTTESPPYEVAVELVLEGNNRMVLRETDGDSRLHQFVFERDVTVRKLGPAAAARGTEPAE